MPFALLHDLVVKLHCEFSLESGMRIIPNRNSRLFPLSLTVFIGLFQIFPTLESLAGCVVFKRGGLEQPHPVRPPGKVTLVPRRRPFISIIPERDDKGGNSQFPEYI